MSTQPKGGDDRGSPSSTTPPGTPSGQAKAGSTHFGAADTAVETAETAIEAGLRPRSNPSTPNPGTLASGSADSSGDHHDSMLGALLLERYEITRKIGQGGMGAVYEATHKLIGKRVAVKVLLEKYARRDQIVARLEQEARLASSIGHEHIVDITDFGITPDGKTFVVMEFLEGESLAELLHREGPLPEQRILHICYQVAGALGAAHAKGIIHRDVKPENVFLLQRKDRDFAKVVDFGISKAMRATDEHSPSESPRLTQTGMVLGTPLYMSPEQARGDDDLDHRIDVYALGVIMYELSTGVVPFQGANYLSIISQVLNDDIKPPRAIRPGLSQEFEAVVLRALDKERENRYQSTEELAADLNLLMEDPGRTTSRARIMAPRRREKNDKRGGLRALGWVAGVAVVVAAVAVTVSAMMSDDDKKSSAAGGAALPAIVDAGTAMAPSVQADAAVAAPEAEVVQIQIASKPEKATIYYQGRILGDTPVIFEAPRQNEKMELVAVLDGYDDTPFTVNPLTDHKAQVVVGLKKIKKGAKAIKIVRPPDTTPPAGGVAPFDSVEPTGSGTAGGDLSGNPYRSGGK